jgi:hypothetical protein
MKNLIIITIFLLCFDISSAQKTNDYVVLIHLNPYLPGDTIYGDIFLPKKISNCMLKIKLLNGKKETYYAEKVKCYRAKEYYFESIPYLDTRVFARRIQEGTINLYFYDAKYHYMGGGAIGGALGAVSEAANTRYFIKLENQFTYIEVPHSLKKIRETIAPLFKDDKECFDKIMSNEFKESQISEVITEYNSKM